MNFSFSCKFEAHSLLVQLKGNWPGCFHFVEGDGVKKCQHVESKAGCTTWTSALTLKIGLAKTRVAGEG